MRTIKFRAWDGRHMDYDYRDASLWNGLLVAEGDTILMQCTGLTDCNGKEIYEGDILRLYSPGLHYPDKDAYESPAVVTFGEHEVGYDSDASTSATAYGYYFSPYPYHGDKMGIGTHVDWSMPELLEVIGNIYETPELVKVKQ